MTNPNLESCESGVHFPHPGEPCEEPEPGTPHTGLVVEPYRDDHNRPRWVFRCCGTDTCDGALSLDHDTESGARAARDRHAAEAHPSPTSVECGLSGERDWWCMLPPGHGDRCIPRPGEAPTPTRSRAGSDFVRQIDALTDGGMSEIAARAATCPARLAHPDAQWACDRPAGHPGGHSACDRGSVGYEAWTDQAAGAVPAGSTLRDQVAEAVYEYNNPGFRWADAHPDDRSAYTQDARAALPVVQAELDRRADLHADTERQLRADLADEVQKREAARSLHRPYNLTSGEQRCFTCVSSEAYPNGVAVHEPWPCPTVQALDTTKEN